jgi:hypothetical protein
MADTRGRGAGEAAGCAEQRRVSFRPRSPPCSFSGEPDASKGARPVREGMASVWPSASLAGFRVRVPGHPPICRSRGTGAHRCASVPTKVVLAASQDNTSGQQSPMIRKRRPCRMKLISMLSCGGLRCYRQVLRQQTTAGAGRLFPPRRAIPLLPLLSPPLDSFAGPR